MMTLGFLGGLGDLLASRVVLHVVAVIISALWGSSWVRKWRKDRLDGTEAELFEFARASVQATWENYVEELKVGRADGKLTVEERQIARRKALSSLKARVTGKARELFEALGKAERDVLIEDAVSSMKEG